MWNIKFKNIKVAHEISLQDALAQYSGNDPVQAATCYLDRHWGIGGSVYELASGFDCPSEGMQLDSELFALSGVSRKRTICIFEMDTALPLSRHYDRGTNPQFSFYGSTRGTALVVRSASSVYNYDYLFDYIFYLDGTIEIRVAASGYLQAGYWPGDRSESPYGTQIAKYSSTNAGVMGSLHGHVMNYKIDFDVVNSNNTFQDVETTLETVKYNFFDFDIVQKRVDRKLIKNEDQGTFTNDPINPHHYLITDQDHLFVFRHNW